MLGRNIIASSNSNFSIDPQVIVIIAFAGFFGLFTSIMLVSHAWMICLNTTTVESLGIQSIKENERSTLTQMHGFYRFAEKAKTKRRWDAEWGKIETEANLWWLGSARANWESVMGKKIWWWFLPIGRSASDGLVYPTNKRFDKEGRLMPRREWPPDLQ